MERNKLRVIGFFQGFFKVDHLRKIAIKFVKKSRYSGYVFRIPADNYKSIYAPSKDISAKLTYGWQINFDWKIICRVESYTLWYTNKYLFSVTYPLSRKVLLQVFLSIPRAGGQILQPPNCPGKNELQWEFLRSHATKSGNRGDAWCHSVHTGREGDDPF